ncbi:MAG: starch-binding outer membrane lipoprotein SusD [Mediterranea sp.]|nr:starch-binding outer membrane lipoprotein SusD [Mediterranea sp.]
MRKLVKNILPALLMAGLALGATSCVKDLDIDSIDPQSTPEFNKDEVFVKAYALLGLTGQKGLSGSPDLDGQDEGESGFYRTVFNCNELMTDECAWAWQHDVGIPEMTFSNWSSSTQRVEWLYTRLGYNITQLNFFLDQTEGLTDAESLHQRAEVRFLRALHYFYFLDFFGKAPFKEHFSQELPVEKGGADLYNFIQTELNECENDMLAPGTAPFGRADKAANWLLHARLCLNAGVYTGTPDWDNARKYADEVIQSAYKLSPSYAQLFMADNDENANAMQEIILPIRQDGLKTRNYGGSTMLICGTRIGGMPRMGTTNGWSCLFAREAMIQKFFPSLNPPMIPAGTEIPIKEFDTDAAIDAFDAQYNARTVDLIAAAGDDRALFYSGAGGDGKVRKLVTDKIGAFTDGFSIVKWQNIRSDGQPTHDTQYPDTDIPLFRLAEAYMTRAEAYFRLGQADLATDDVNVLRRRAHATEFNTNVTEQNLIDEWAREFYMEGRRRSDLIRFGMFTTTKYLWDWKGGTKDGSAVPSFYNRYPIPASDLNNNRNMTQNPGY